MFFFTKITNIDRLLHNFRHFFVHLSCVGPLWVGESNGGNPHNLDAFTKIEMLDF